MRILPFLIIAGVAAASNLRGGDESRELQTVIYGNSRGRGRTRSSGTALFIVEDDNDRSTRDCADEVAAVFEDDFDDVFIVDDDDDARNGDIVAVIDGGTDCDSLIDDIERELDDTDDHTATTVYVYYGSGSRYYRNRARSRTGYRLYYGRYGRNRNRSRNYWDGYRNRNRSKKRKYDHDHDRKGRNRDGNHKDGEGYQHQHQYGKYGDGHD